MDNIKMVIEETGNLFDLDDSWALAHCVGSDFVMGAGIAVEFKKRFGMQDWLIKNCRGVGTALLLPSTTTTSKNIFYLVTKYKSRYEKPTYESIEKSVVDMFAQAKQNNIVKIAMPRIGCGLDGKTWTEVKKIIQKHKPEDIIVCVRTL